MTEGKTTSGPGPENKGGGFRGGPKRWTGRGPAPARHIPWPEIFKHHISVVEGHLKMIDMVRKHTVEGSGNWRTIMDLVDRTNEMLRVSKQQARTFVAPPGQREQVPLGSSSASMYPGYSPADHEYGKAAEEFGKAAAAARAKGIEIKHPDVEYEVGQAKGSKKRALSGSREVLGAKGQSSGSGSGSGSEKPTTQTLKENGTSNGKAKEEAIPEGDNPFFVIDTKPTPVNLPGISHPPTKRSASPPPSTESKKHKKAKKHHDKASPNTEDNTKKHHDEASPKTEQTPKIEFEDISDQVDARIKEKEERRRRKGDRKRKRESDGEAPAASSDTIVAPAPAATKAEAEAEPEVEKPKKKKVKKERGEGLVDRTVSSKRAGDDVEDGGEEGGNGYGEGKKRKKRKKYNAGEGV